MYRYMQSYIINSNPNHLWDVLNLKYGATEFVIVLVGTPKIYTTTGFGPRKNREMAGVDHLLVYMQTAVK